MNLKDRPVPEVVSIIAMGDSRIQYTSEVVKSGSRFGVSDETWVINKLAELFHHDLLFRIDDLRQMRLCNNQVILDRDGVTIHDRFDNVLRNHDKPIITSTAYPEYPMSVEYPLENVINAVGTSYFQTCPAYAVAFAIYIGVKKLKMFGCDYTYRQTSHSIETGRANLEHMLTIAINRGIEVEIARKSTLLNTNCPPEEYFYGYGGRIIEVLPDKDNPDRTKVVRREDLDRMGELEQERKNLLMLHELLGKYNDIIEPDNPDEALSKWDEHIEAAGVKATEERDALQKEIDKKFKKTEELLKPENKPKPAPKKKKNGRSKKNGKKEK